MRKSLLITENEKSRILNMHKSASSRQYLTEQYDEVGASEIKTYDSSSQKLSYAVQNKAVGFFGVRVSNDELITIKNVFDGGSSNLVGSLSMAENMAAQLNKFQNAISVVYVSDKLKKGDSVTLSINGDGGSISKTGTAIQDGYNGFECLFTNLSPGKYKITESNDSTNYVELTIEGDNP